MFVMRALWKRWWVWSVVAGALALCALRAGASISSVRRTRGALGQALAKARAGGLPLTPEELDRWYPDPPAGLPNAADTYAEAFACLSREWDWGELLMKAASTEPGSSDDTKQLVAECLESNSKALALLHAAAAVEHCRYPIRLSAAPNEHVYPGYDGTGHLPPHLRSVRVAGRLLWVEALSNIKSGQNGEAAKSLVSIMALGRSLVREPLLASQITRLTTNIAGVLALQRCLGRTAFAEEDLRLLAGAFTNSTCPEPWERAAVGERCLGLAVFRKKAPSKCLDYLELASEYIDVWRAPIPDRIQAEEALGKRVAQVRDTYLIPWEPGLSLRYAGTVTNHDVLIACARVALAVELYRIHMNALPTDLAELVPEHLEALPSDPYDGLPLRYSRRAQGYVVYSVHWDKGDDGGGLGDIVFAVER